MVGWRTACSLPLATLAHGLYNTLYRLSTIDYRLSTIDYRLPRVAHARRDAAHSEGKGMFARGAFVGR